MDALRSFLDEGLDDPAAGVSAFLSGAGIRVIQLDRPTPPLRGQWAAAAMQHLMASTCNGWSSFYREWPWIRTATSASCEPFREELRIVTMEGNQVAADGDRAFAAAAARCRAGRPVRLGLDGGGVAIIPFRTIKMLSPVHSPTWPSRLSNWPRPCCCLARIKPRRAVGRKP